MFLSRLKRVAEIVGLACFVLLAGLGMLSLLQGEAATAASLSGGLAAPVFAAQEPLAPEADAAPLYMNYQGMLRDVEGNPLTGSYDLTFRVYAGVADPVGSALWSDAHAGVVVTDGWFNVLLGDGAGNPMPPSLFSGPDRFVGVQVGTDDELLPRQRFASMPYALEAQNAVAADNGAPPGTIVAYGGTTMPDRWHWCDGASLNKDEYPELFAAIGYNFGGSGDNFNLPNLMGRVPLGAGSGAGLTPRTVGQPGGAETHTLSIAEMPSHNHTVTSIPNADHTNGYFPGSMMGDPETLQSSFAGGNQPHNNMQPYLVVSFIIKY
ncbi:MAG: tail fiber protein [Anaerolineae bacterium]|nr:tail fiber protein [Anaerolineae bacterium]